ncbi:MAG: restriction endonuclease [Patescibacteria group bacterium]
MKDIPSYQELFSPLLALLSDNKEHTLSEVTQIIADQLNISEEKQKELYPSGQSIYKNRMGWARTCLKKAGLIEYPQRGSFLITKEGINLLSTHPNNLTEKDLILKYPLFKEFVYGTKKEKIVDNEDLVFSKTPDDVINEAYNKITSELSDELIEKIKSLSPTFFEKLVVELLIKMGYGGSLNDAGQAIGRTGDEGIDGIIKEDKLGLDVIYIQAKRWEGVVGRPEIHKFAGALQGQRSRKGIFITTSLFTKEALEYVKAIDNKIILIDGKRLSQLMIEFNLGVSIINSFEIKKVDNDYFIDE